YGAGRVPNIDHAPGSIVVCVPPGVRVQIEGPELIRYPHALVADIAIDKSAPHADLRDLRADLRRYLGTHPMAGRERGGPIAARADLFIGRPWVIARHDDISYRRAAPIEDMILDLGAVPVEMTASSHDESVALVSHVPQLISTLMAV